MDTKTCFKCSATLPLSEFYAHPMTGDGLLGKCKTCTKADATRHRNANLDKYRAYDRGRYKGARKAAQGVYSREYTVRNPEKQAARSRVAHAVARGALVPEPCEVCGAEKVHAHHDDYTKPLDVRWLCAICHSAHHHK